MNTSNNKTLFWGCFVALITTSFAFTSRIVLCGAQFATDFGLNKVQVGELIGAGIWPFGISIIVFSLFIDKIGYKAAMVFSFLCYAIYIVLAFMAYGAIQGLQGEALLAAQAKGLKLLTTGSIILALGNGTVEAYINPVVATLFNKEKSKWLNILHAGWPTGLVVGGLISIALAGNKDWRVTLGIILIPAIAFLVMLIGKEFPRNEREQAGVGYLDMLKELGAFGALVGFGLVFSELGKTFGWSQTVSWILTGVVVAIFAVTTKSFGRPLLAVLIIIMMPLAITEIGTDGWITNLMASPLEAKGHHGAWVLIYTSLVMMILRFFAGPIIHRFSPLGLLAGSAVLAIVGLTALSKCNGAGLFAIFGAATLYAFGKTFFWPTMLGVTSEQCPKGGALTLNTMGGIGMLAVGIFGFPFIGFLQESTATAELKEKNPAIHQTVVVDKSYLLGKYEAIDPVKSTAVADEAAKKSIKDAETISQFSALGKMAMFPAFMLAGYIGLILYFKSKGGYKPVEIAGGSGH